MENKKVNMGINDGNEFFAHELSVNFNPMQFIFDFKCITPRVDPRTSESPMFVMKHNVVMVDIFHAKKIHELLGEVLKKYEQQYGTIEMPKVLKKLEKEKSKEKADVSKETIPDYLG